MDPNDIKIVRQLEYYFGDINLVRDNFMQDEMKKDEGWFSLETMLKFKRLQQLTTEQDVIVQALKTVSSDLVQLDEDGKKIRRDPNKPLPDTFKDALTAFKDCAVYIKGLPKDTDLSDVQIYLERHGGVTAHIQLRKDGVTKQFKGSVYATFKNKDDAEKFVKSEEAKTQFKDGVTLDEPLVIMWREAHLASKKEQAKKMKEDRAKERAEAEAARMKERAQFEKEKALSKMVRGTLLKIETVKQPDHSDKEKELFTEIRELFKPMAADFYLDFFDGVLYARFKEENTAALAWQKLKESLRDEDVTMKDGTKVEAVVLTGDDEEKAWVLVLRARKQRLDQSRRGGSAGRRGRGRGRGGGFRGDRNGEPPAKRAKSDN